MGALIPFRIGVRAARAGGGGGGGGEGGGLGVVEEEDLLLYGVRQVEIYPLVKGRGFVVL